MGEPTRQGVRRPFRKAMIVNNLIAVKTCVLGLLFFRRLPFLLFLVVLSALTLDTN
jgi:hypothetical protein